ncbi:sugar phosphate isomerase/epimerase [Donghicola sp. C2-DW-16]|uniref:Sugar phosphate isomerase/epimerase n=1 Tax=Donghicola mangrovi TaxID=2729614 RepID=A0ABX2PF82_9RHOB|nr:sugar phosphate isomerase/epimerase family protein [Donghicola mangrovi]NVO28167.1 sugar phosphate isomerase/epimerase [Donghicola mangrovi]
MKLGIDWQKLPEALKRGPMASLDHVAEMGLDGIFFPTVLDMSPTLDRGFLLALKAKADEMGLYLESGLGKINPYCSAEAPELRAAGNGDIMAGLTRMIELAAEVGLHELWISPGNFKGQYPGRLANDRFRTDIDWADQLAAMQKIMTRLAPILRVHGSHMNMEAHDEITSFEILRLVEAVGEDVTGATYDTANGLQRGEHPVWVARRLAPYIRQTHIKDAYVARAPGGLDFQGRACGEGIVDFEAILPILHAANPALNLSLEMAASCEDRPRAANPRQCIEIDDPVWRAAHPDLTPEEYDAYMALVDGYEDRIASGEIEDWASYETRNYGYPGYQVQPYGYTEARDYIRRSADHIRETGAVAGVPVGVPQAALV